MKTTVGIKAVYKYQPYIIFAWRKDEKSFIVEEYSVITTKKVQNLHSLKYDKIYSFPSQYSRLLWSAFTLDGFYKIEVDKSLIYLETDISELQLYIRNKHNE